jgi:site-specific recombinase XerD
VVLGVAVAAVASQPPTHPDVEDTPAAAAAVISFSAAWERYRLYLIEQGRASSTVCTYRPRLYAWNDHLAAKRRPTHWQKAASKDLTAFLARPSDRGGPLAATTKAKEGAAVKGLYRWAYDAELLTRDPMAAFRVPRQGHAPIPRAIPWGDTPDGTGMATLLGYAATDPALEVMVLLGYRAGLRCAEIASLRIEDVWLGDEDPRMRVDGKGGYEGVVTLHPWLRDALRGFLAARSTRGPVIDNPRAPGQGVTAKHVGRVVGRAMRGLGTTTEFGTPATPHSLRHTFGTELRRLGVNVDDIRRALRHRHLSSTQIYMEGAGEGGRRAILTLPGDRRTRRAG